MDTSNPSRPKGKSPSQGDARGASQAYWVSFSLRGEAAPLAETRAGGTVLTERGRVIEACWRTLGEGRPSLETDSVAIGPRSVQGILRLRPAHPEALTLPAAARLFKLLSARALSRGGAANRSAAGMWKRGFTEKPLESLKQIVDARSAFKAEAEKKPKAKSKPKR